MIKQAIRVVNTVFGCLILFVLFSWILAFHRLFPLDSKLTGLAFFSPYGFIFFVIPLILIYLLIGDKKTALVSFLTFIVFFVSYGDFSFSSTQNVRKSDYPSTKSISVVALNVRYYSYGLEKVLSAIKKIDADIYLLSENVLTVEEKNRLENDISPWRFYMGRQEGTAIISKLPVLDFKEIELPSKQASLSKSNEISKQHLNPNRSFLHAIVDVDGALLHAISIRFLAGRPAERSFWATTRWAFYVLGEQLKELDFFINYINKLEGPMVFGGDLNATPSSIVVQRISELATDSYLEKHFWGGFTFWTQFPSYARLDYLFNMNGLYVEDSKRLSIVVSDHYPVLGRFWIPAE